MYVCKKVLAKLRDSPNRHGTLWRVADDINGTSLIDRRDRLVLSYRLLLLLFNRIAEWLLEHIRKSNFKDTEPLGKIIHRSG